MIKLAISTVPLPAGQSITFGWFQNTAGLQAAEGLAVVSFYSDQQGQVQIYQSDDITNANMTLPGFSAQLNPLKAGTMQVPITHQAWKAVVQNNSVAQTTLDVVVSVSSSIDLAIIAELQKANVLLNRLYEPYDARAPLMDSANPYL